MQFISSTLVEFEQPDITPVELGKLLAQKQRTRAFYYELYDSFLRGEKYIVQYLFYTLNGIKRTTRTQLQKQLAAISPKADCILPEHMKTLREEAGDRETVLYTDGEYPEEQAIGIMQKAGLSMPGQIFRETDPKTLCELKKAVFYTSRKEAMLLLAHTPELLANPLFYPVAEEFPILLRSLTFPWMCRKNLKIMQAMTLYQELKS